jgi:hypothetical protein
MINKSNAGIPPAYNQYIMKPTRIKQIGRPLLSQGLSGEKMTLNSLSNKNTNASNSTALTNVINIENQKNSINMNSGIGKGVLNGMANYALTG